LVLAIFVYLNSEGFSESLCRFVSRLLLRDSARRGLVHLTSKRIRIIVSKTAMTMVAAKIDIVAILIIFSLFFNIFI